MPLLQVLWVKAVASLLSIVVNGWYLRQCNSMGQAHLARRYGLYPPGDMFGMLLVCNSPALPDWEKA
jgi:hypothetical protein